MKSKVFASGLAIVLGFLSPIGLVAGVSEVAIAQTTVESEKKLEADQLSQQGYQKYKAEQVDLAINHWEKALILYTEIQDLNQEYKMLQAGNYLLFFRHVY